MKKICVTGAGGFVGSHLVTYLRHLGHWVRGVDLKYPEYGKTSANEFEILDLRDKANCLQSFRGVEQVYALAADMGGIGYIHSAHAKIAFNNALISNYSLEAARIMGVKRYLFTSSACVYPLYLQTGADVVGLKESDAYPAEPEDAYGWEKLVTERTCRHYTEDYGMETRVARFHNIYGPEGAWDGGKEKAPAALCRKIAVCRWNKQKEIEIWGDGEQTRSFMYIDDCVRLLYLLMESNHGEPINIGTDRLVTINELVDIIAWAAAQSGKAPDWWPPKKKHIIGTQGVRGRNADLTLMESVLGEPRVSLEEGILNTYRWIEKQVRGDG